MKANKHITMVLLTAGVISGSILVYSFAQRTTQESARYAVEVFSVSDGWGYDILVDGRVLIHQESIPSYGSKKVFRQKEQARQAANLVLKKLKRNEGMPTLTRFEVKEICGE